MTQLLSRDLDAGAARPPGTRRDWLTPPAAVSLLAGPGAGLVRLGVPTQLRTDRLPEVHGMLLVLGFVGTLICLERAAAALRLRVGQGGFVEMSVPQPGHYPSCPI